MTEFRRVASLSEIPPGERFTFVVKRRAIVLFNVDGLIYALEDQCSHEEVPLSDGYLDGCEIECAQHGARFDLRTGAVTAPPAVSPVRVYAVRITGDDVEVGW